MPFFKQTPAQKFTPKDIKFSKLYKSNTQGGKLGDNILINIKSALRKSGYSDERISRIITADKPIPVNQMKEIAATLNKSRVFGFDNDPDQTVKRYLNQERVKAQSIANIRKEHILETAEENLANAGTTSLNQKAIGPSSTKPGEASFLARRNTSNIVRSFSPNSSAQKTNSLISRRGSSAISRPGIGQAGSSGRGISLKPKF